MSTPSLAKIWWKTLRPATLWAGATPAIVGAAVAFGLARRDLAVAHVGLAFAALACALLLQIGCNLINDYEDFARGADTPDRLGPARATAQGWLTGRQVLSVAVGALGLALVLGLWAATLRGWPLVAIGVAGLGAAVAYTAGPFPLGYKGLGDLFVMIFFGFAATAGTCFAVTGTWSAEALLAGYALGALATAILVVNNLRDRHTDARANKRTLAVRFGERFARRQYAVLVVSAFVAAGVGAAVFQRPGWLLPLLAIPLAIRELAALRTVDGAALNPHLGATARLELLFGLLLSVGVLL